MPRQAPPTLTADERNARRDAKRSLILSFLASGEVFSSAEIVSQLLACSRSVAWATLASLEKAGALKSEEHQIDARRVRIWGITPHGLAIADAFDGQFFELGRTASGWIPHRLDTQRMRLRAESAGWGNWTTERALRLRGLKKVPDAAATSPAGRRVAIEIERHCKTPKRYEQLIVAYLQEIRAGRFDLVHFLCPPGVDGLVERALARIHTVKFAGDSVTLDAAQRSRFRFFSFDTWPPTAQTGAVDG